jgi:RNA polymerase sigma factor (sigma-70 family)
MPKETTGTFLQHLREVLRAEEKNEFSDGHLLRQYLDRQDEKAFAEILCRHGPMVMGVCRRVLGNQDSEDVFQTTFLLLVQKGRSIARQGSVASWLHGVAYRCALKARALAARRREREMVDVRAPEAGGQELLWRDLRAVLDQEMDQLPAKYRTPLLLCCLEGKTFQEVSQELGWSLGTVATRVARAKNLLRGRLTRRGVTLAGVAGVSFLPVEVTAATVPTALAAVTQKTAGAIAAGSMVEALGPRITLLTKEVQKAMFCKTIRKGLTVVLALGLIAVGLAVALPPTLAALVDGSQPVGEKKQPVTEAGTRKPDQVQPGHKPPGNKPVAESLKITVDLPKMSPTVDQVNAGAFTFPVILENTDKKDLVLWPFLGLRVFDARGKEVERSTRLGRFGITFTNSVIEGIPFITLKPGAMHKFDVKIAQYIHDPRAITGWQVPSAGEYRLEFLYEYNPAAEKKDLGKGATNLDDPNQPWNRAYEVRRKLDVKLKVVDNP